MFQTKFVDRIKTCYMLVTLQNSCCLYAEKYSAAARLATGHDVIWHMCPACCITKATDTHTHLEYVILTAFPWQQWLSEHASLLPLYGHFLSCLCRDTEDTACSTFRRHNT